MRIFSNNKRRIKYIKKNPINHKTQFMVINRFTFTYAKEKEKTVITGLLETLKDKPG
jgi:hypothetical protein